MKAAEPIVIEANDQGVDRHMEQKVDLLKNLATRQGWKILAVFESSSKAVQEGLPTLGTSLWEMQTKECSCVCCLRCVGLTAACVHLLIVVPIFACITACQKSAAARCWYAICKQGVISAEFSSSGKLDEGFTRQGIQYRSWSEIGSIEISQRKVIQIISARGAVVQEGQVLGTNMPWYVEEPEQVHSLLTRMMIWSGRSTADVSILQQLTEQYQQILDDLGQFDEGEEVKFESGKNIPPAYVTAPSAFKRVLVYIEGKEESTKKLVKVEENMTNLLKKVVDLYEKEGIHLTHPKLIHVKFNIELEDSEMILNDDVVMVRTVNEV